MVLSAQKSWLSSAKIFQVFVGRWQAANHIDHSSKVFDILKDLPFENLEKIDINTIYLLGIFDNQSPIIVSNEEGVNLATATNRCPSVFSITNHKLPSPSLGTIEELKNLINSLHSKKFKVIIDFVPNHTSTTHPWINSHPQFYTSNDQGYVREFSGDVYKLNYQTPELREEMVSILETICNWGADGVRCDMAHLIPKDFWIETIKKIKAINGDFSFIAEAYSNSVFDLNYLKEYINLGFDGIYHSALYENLKKVYQQNQPKSFLEEHINYTRTRKDLEPYLINYLSNHDDSLPLGAEKDLLALLSMIYNLEGSTLIYNGLLNGQYRRLAHHFIDILPDKMNELFYIPEEFSNKLKNSNSSTVTFDVGASKIEAALVDENFQVSDVIKQPTIKTSYEDFVAQITSILNIYLEKYPSIQSISIALPGIISQSGEIRFPGGTLSFLNQKNLKNELEKYFKIPIYLENDANCFALGEAIAGAGKNYQTVLGVTWGTGIGSGIVVDKKLFKGAGAAGEIGHIPVTTSNLPTKCGCGKANCLEVYASGSAIQNQYRELGGEIKDATVADIAQSKDAIALAVIDQAVYFLAEIIAATIDVVNPNIVIIGGGLSHIADDVFNKLKRQVRELEITSIQHTIITKHQLPNAALIGAAHLARKQNESS